MAKRLKGILARIILDNQGGLIKGRKIWDNIILVQEAIHSSLKNHVRTTKVSGGGHGRR